jgi:hypothetical protein
MDKIWTVNDGNSFDTKEEAIEHARKKTALDKYETEYSVYQLIGTAKKPIPADVIFTVI